MPLLHMPFVHMKFILSHSSPFPCVPHRVVLPQQRDGSPCSWDSSAEARGGLWAWQ